MKQIINTAIVGFGLSGKVFHAPFIDLHPGFRLSKVVERHTGHSQELYPEVEIVRDFNKIIDDQNIDLVVICTPNIYHYPMAKACLEAGKHIVVEKPFMPTSKEADEIIQLADEKDRKVFVYQNRRWDGDFLTIRKLMNSRLLGDIQYFESHFDRFSPDRKRAAWRDEELPGSGILFDLGSHLIDQALCLFGMPESIKADIRSQREGSMVDDFFEVTLSYSMVQAVVTAGMLVENHELRFLINGSKGTFIKYGLDPQEEKLKQGFKPEGDEWGTEDFENWALTTFVREGLHFDGSIETEPGNYMAFYENVFAVLTAGAGMEVSPGQARDVIKLIELAFESNRINQEINFNN